MCGVDNNFELKLRENCLYISEKFPVDPMTYEIRGTAINIIITQ